MELIFGEGNPKDQQSIISLAIPAFGNYDSLCEYNKF